MTDALRPETRAVLNTIGGPPEVFKLGHPRMEPVHGAVDPSESVEWRSYISSVPLLIAEVYSGDSDVERGFSLEWADDGNAYLVSMRRLWPKAPRDAHGREHIFAPAESVTDFEWSQDPTSPYRVAARALSKSIARGTQTKERIRAALDDLSYSLPLSFREAEDAQNRAIGKLTVAARDTRRTDDADR